MLFGRSSNFQWIFVGMYDWLSLYVDVLNMHICSQNCDFCGRHRCRVLVFFLVFPFRMKWYRTIRIWHSSLIRKLCCNANCNALNLAHFTFSYNFQLLEDRISSFDFHINIYVFGHGVYSILHKERIPTCVDNGFLSTINNLILRAEKVIKP